MPNERGFLRLPKEPNRELPRKVCGWTFVKFCIAKEINSCLVKDVKYECTARY